MSSTQAQTVYTLSSGLGFSTTEGTQCNGALQIYVVAGSDFADADAFAFQEALLAAFPAAWNVVLGDISISKQDTSETMYATDATATPPTFS